MTAVRQCFNCILSSDWAGRCCWSVVSEATWEPLPLFIWRRDSSLLAKAQLAVGVAIPLAMSSAPSSLTLTTGGTGNRVEGRTSPSIGESHLTRRHSLLT